VTVFLTLIGAVLVVLGLSLLIGADRYADWRARGTGFRLDPGFVRLVGGLCVLVGTGITYLDWMGGRT
jgi:hypothetical protein